MSFIGVAFLGACAGLTIFLGLPIAKIGRPRPTITAFLNATAIGILLFILYDVISNANEKVVAAMNESLGRGVGYAAILVAGLALGLLGLVGFEVLVLRRARPALPSGPGALAVDDDLARSTAVAGDDITVAGRAIKASRQPLAPQQRIALFIATGIGLHNFSEGLAIGQSAVSGAYRLFLLLVVGFGLHNATEGFGITAPLIGRTPSWRFLTLCGLIGGGPTFLGTVLGYQFVSVPVSIAFLALAAGAIIYVIGELQHAGRKIGSHHLATVGLLLGFVLAYGTDLFLKALGN